MRIGIIGPSKLSYVEEINSESKKIISEISKALKDKEILIVPDKNSSAEFFAREYLRNNGKKVYSIIPLDDKEFGFPWLDLDLGEKINCGTWRNQPEKFNEECDILLCIGYATGVLIEIAYSKWFGRKSKISTLSSKDVEQKKKKVYIVKELVSGELPKDSIRDLDIEYISYKDVGEILKN
jgi:hypothetical protein